MTWEPPDPALDWLCAELGGVPDWAQRPTLPLVSTQPGSHTHELLETLHARGYVTLVRKPRRFGSLAVWRITRQGAAAATHYRAQRGDAWRTIL